MSGADWAEDAVWYQIFPERFRNGAGEASNPRAEDQGGAPEGWRLSRWGGEWYARDEWERRLGPRFRDGVFRRRYGGDLRGVREKLGYLAGLGVNALYLNPVFWSQSLHKYDARSYVHVDPCFGPDRAKDLRWLAAAGDETGAEEGAWGWTAADLELLDLVEEAHARGMRVILDGVFNHCGTAHPAFRDARERGDASPCRSWFQWRADGGWEAWDGRNGGMPAFRREGDTLDAGVKAHLFAVTRRWMRPRVEGREREGVDGWRLDVAFCLPHGFWREWHALVRKLNPEAYTTAEVVGPSDEWVREGEFDAAMNYEWTYPTLGFFTPGADALDAAEFRRCIDVLRARHGDATLRKMQNLLDSHDTGRVLTMLESGCPPFTGWDEYFRWALAENPALRTGKPGPLAKERLRLAAVWQFTGLGAPMIFYGTEAGLWGANDPCDRQPMLWDDIPAADETLNARGEPVPRQARLPDTDLQSFYAVLAALRARWPALRRGSFAWLEAGEGSTVAFERRWKSERVCVCLERNPARWSVTARDEATGREERARGEGSAAVFGA